MSSIQSPCSCPVDSQPQLLSKIVANQVVLFNLLSGINSQGVVSLGLHGTASASFARPSDTNAYAALDVVSDSTVASTLMRFANIARALGKGGYITKAKVTTDNKLFLPRLRLWLFTVNNPTVNADNAGFGLKYANRSLRVGYIDFPALSTENSSNSDAAQAQRTDDLRLAFTCDPASQDLYGLLETLDAATPTSGQNFYVDLESEQN